MVQLFSNLALGLCLLPLAQATLFLSKNTVPHAECYVECVQSMGKPTCITSEDDWQEFLELMSDASGVGAWAGAYGVWGTDEATTDEYFGCGTIASGDWYDAWPVDGSGLDAWGGGVNGVPNTNIMTVIEENADVEGGWAYTQAAPSVADQFCVCTTEVVEGTQKLKGLEEDDSTYAPERYVATETVVALHGFWHAGSDEFDPTDVEYAKSLAAYFVLCIVVSILLVIVMWCNGFCASFACHRRTCACCYRLGRTKGKILTICVILLSGGTMLGSYHGRTAFHDSVGDFSNLMRMGASIFETLEEQAGSMSDGGKQFVTLTNSSGCMVVGDLDGTEVLSTLAVAFAEAADTMYELVCPPEDEDCNDDEEECANSCLSETMYQAADDFEDKEAGMPYVVDLGIMGLTAGCWGLAILAILATLTNCVCDDIILTILASAIMVVTCIFCAFLITISVTVADFCAGDPADTIVNLAADLGVETPMIPYYTQCIGTNPFSPPLNVSVFTLESINNTMLILGSPIPFPNPLTNEMDLSEPICDPDAMLGLRSQTGRFMEAVEEIGGLFACDVVNPIIKQITDEIMCGTFLDGIYFMWVVLLFSCFLMWVAFMLMPMSAHELKPKKVHTEGGFDDLVNELEGEKYAVPAGGGEQGTELVGANVGANVDESAIV